MDSTAAPARVPRMRVDGVLLLDKPVGLSSNAALQRARRLFNAAKAGHTGTLDPLASGLLPLCLGEATKFAQALLDARKEYLATVQFGRSTSTGDAEGEVTGEALAPFTADELRAVLRGFIGTSQQVPPRFAALKFEGRNLYEYAREGDVLDLLSHDGDAGTAVLRVGCSKGTYVRALVEDIATALGTLAHLAGLRRVASGPFRIEDALTLEALEAIAPSERPARLLPVDAPLRALPAVTLDAEAAAAMVHGRQACSPEGAGGRLRAYDAAGRFLGIVESTDSVLRAVRLVDTASLRVHAGTA
jgi:tRNA pseudouridine55 synthase